MAGPAPAAAARTLIDIPLEPLTAAAFAEYGWLLDASVGQPSFSRPNLDLWTFPFASDAPPRLQIMRYHQQKMAFSTLERHVCVTEARFPIASARAVLIVGGSTEDAPEPDAVRAFLIDGSAGIMFKPGIWHGLDCYPADASSADFLFLSDQATEREIEAQPEPVSGERTHIARYGDGDSPAFQVVDPSGLIQKP